MKRKILISIGLILSSILSYSAITVGGIDYFSPQEIKTMGFKVDENFLEFKNQRFELECNHVESQGAVMKFSDVILERDNIRYYNSFLIEELRKADFKNQKKLKNIVSLSPGITEKIYDLKMGDKLVGRTEFCKYPQEALKVESMGSLMEPKLEKVLSKRPGIVLMETHYNSNFAKKLKDLGIEHNIYRTPKNIEGVYEVYRDIGESIGVSERGAIVTAALRSQVATYNYMNRNLKRKPKVYFVVGTGRGEYTAGKDTFINDLITCSGGVNIAGKSEGWKYSLEEIIVNDPDYIIGGKLNIDLMKKNPNYSRLSAIKKGNIYAVDEHVFVLPGSRGIMEGIPQLMKIFKSQY